jgi:hypothetical protein
MNMDAKKKGKTVVDYWNQFFPWSESQCGNHKVTV